MRGPLIVGAVGVTLLALAGCATDAAAPSGTATAASPARAAAQQTTATATAAGEVFTSPQYGYAAVLPTGWTALPATSGWDGGDVDHTAEYADRFTDTDGNEFFVIGTADEETTDEFADRHLAWLAENRGCPIPATEQTVSVDGVPAARVAVHCPDGIFGPTLVSKVILATDGTVLIVTSFSPDTGSDDFPLLDAFVASMRWTERP